MMAGEEQLLGGRYQLGGPLGRGGMAEVRRAVDLRLQRAVAVKQLNPDLATDPTFQTRFRREAQSAGSLNHPNIVAVYDTGEEIDPRTQVSIPYIVMELVEGETLRAVLRSGQKVLPERALELSAEVLDAIGYSHRAGIIHRDIKPSNVMVTPGGAVKVMDFGIARAVEDTSSDLTQTAAVIGTAQYLSPEQARGEPVDARSDIYSAGCLLYELLVGRPPFVGESAVSVAYQHVREAPVPPSQLDPSVTPAMDAITLRALAKDPADRYQDAAAMRADIDRVLAGGRPATPLVPLPVVPVPTLTTALTAPVPAAAAVAVPLETEPRRGIGLALLATVLVLALLGGGAYAALRYLRPDDATVALVSVPAVLGKSPARATSLLNAQHLVAQVENVSGKDDDTLNTVTRQTPLGGNQVAVGSVVVIEVNLGEKSAAIPDGLTGQDVDQAKTDLEEAGFTDVHARKADDEPAGSVKDEVLSVDPTEGATVALDKRITLVYATGKSAVTSAPTTSASAAKEKASGKKAAKSRDRATTTSPTSTATRSADPSPSPTDTASSSPSASRTPSASSSPTISSAPPDTPEPSASVTSATPEPSGSSSGKGADQAGSGGQSPASDPQPAAGSAQAQLAPGQTQTPAP